MTRTLRVAPLAGICLALGLLAGAGASWAGDAAAGKEKAAVCGACHGLDGNSQAPDFPRLAGQHEDYLLRALIDYKSGQRKNPIMAGQVANLEKKDMADLAAWFASQPGLVTKR
ncbi:MAG: cytochrome c [Zoogloeaceae bacterium]|nr:cytochrome c [Rhodocyclaceae bacterium]MCP5233137.1 cytochrome c [Zoogloeaceae bacterium]MCP5238444.1 cytochrome c [Zoogloeaceae bacterium]MCP5254643.1 cytochrome c [Zoogloeaceae bacterium]MCP5295110.1 cytochrome c [Zoogloeaceae bacterium]